MQIPNDQQINNENDNNNQNTDKIGDNIYYIKATECRYKDYLLERERILYERFFNKGFGSTNKITITLFVFSIIIIIFSILGFSFRISNNKGYKEYKSDIEKVLKQVNTNLPDDLEMDKILNFNKLFYLQVYNNTIYYNNKDCTYLNFRIGLCNIYSYKRYCNYSKYLDKVCNFVDYRFYEYGKFLCDYEDYSKKYCTYQQYKDYTNKYFDDFIYIGGKPKRIDMSGSFEKGDNDSVSFTFENLNGISFFKFWCDIGKYDTPVFISLIILIFIFIILFSIDICNKKNNISNGIIFYIIVILYMILYIVVRIFICLLFCLLVFSIVVTSSSPEFKVHRSYFYFYSDNKYKNINNNATDYQFKSSQKIWNNKRIYAIINASSLFFLFIFVSLLDQLKFLILNYLGLNFEENIKTEIKRNISIRLGDEMYKIEVIFKKEIYLDEVISRQKIKFKEIKFDKLGNNIYYLKLTNKGLIDQLAFSEWNYPNINEGFNRLRVIFDLIYVVLFFTIVMTKFQISQEYVYRFLKYAIDLGFSFKFDEKIKKYGELENAIIKYRFYVYIIISFIILLCMLKRAFFGGFKNNLLFLIFFIISILFIIFNFVSLILSIIFLINSWICFSVFLSRINFYDDIIIAKLAVLSSLNTIIFLIQIIIFGKSIAYTIFIYSIKSENDKIEGKNQLINNNSDSTGRREEGFEFIGLDMKSYYFQAINNTILPKNLFYIKTENRKRLIFVPENPDLIIQNGNENVNNYHNGSNNINSINNGAIIKGLSLERKLNNNGNNINDFDNKGNNKSEETNNDDLSNVRINNDKNHLNEIIGLINENKALKMENEKIKQQIQNIKNQLNMINKSYQ